MKKSFPLLPLLVLLLACNPNKNTDEEANTIADSKGPTYAEPFRPQFHFTPPEKWMNDPNGLVFHNDTYHLFYQYYPEDIVWGPMHWGHAVSTDLIHWEHKPIALYPNEHGYVFSGSAVVDYQNTSGFGTKDNPPLVAIFTYHLMEGEKSGRNDFQTQGIAYSLDNGDTWTHYEGNPVIGNDGIRDFRDPKVFWNDETEQWVLLLVAGDHVKFYKSLNLKEWELMSEFGKDQGAHGGVWECPDLFKMKVEGTEEEQWVLLVSINPGAPNGGSGTQFFVGNFDGTTFSSDQQQSEWIDLGRDNYAGITYNNVPDDHRIFIGWMSNWDYAQQTPTEVWRSAMTLPREMKLYRTEGGDYYLRSYPAADLTALYDGVSDLGSIKFESKMQLDHSNLNASELTFNWNGSQDLALRMSNTREEHIQFNINSTDQQLEFDRTHSGILDFEPRFAGEVQTQPYTPVNEEVEVRMILDASSVEIFIDKGRYIFTNQIFPNSPYTCLEIWSPKEGTLKNFKAATLKSIWNNE